MKSYTKNYLKVLPNRSVDFPGQRNHAPSYPVIKWMGWVWGKFRVLCSLWFSFTFPIAFEPWFECQKIYITVYSDKNVWSQFWTSFHEVYAASTEMSLWCLKINSLKFDWQYPMKMNNYGALEWWSRSRSQFLFMSQGLFKNGKPFSGTSRCFEAQLYLPSQTCFDRVFTGSVINFVSICRKFSKLSWF